MARKVADSKLFSGKKVLVMGVGLHGGGVSTIKWLLGRGAQVTATDLRDRKTLAPSLDALKGHRVRYVLGRHDEADFRTHDMVVVSPGVPRENPFLAVAAKARIPIENPASLFFRHMLRPSIAVTGTRGKTTTTLWVATLLKKRLRFVRQSGTPEHALLDEFERLSKLPAGAQTTPAVSELSSWQLEYLGKSERAPHIAAITNIYPEHLNRYANIEAYADAKANIFLGQHSEDKLVLNCDNPWCDYFVKKKPRASVFYISIHPLPPRSFGAYVKNNRLVLRIGAKEERSLSVERFRRERGEHNLENLIRAVLIAKLYCPDLKITETDALRLPSPHMREEIIYRSSRLTIVNDSCATSPEGTLAALERFAGVNIVLIAGGTDKNLEFGPMARAIKKYVHPENLFLIEGSATEKLLHALRNVGFSTTPETKKRMLRECVSGAFAVAKKVKGRSVILFSPGAASFEKFLHEFDRGAQFNALVKRSVARKQ